MRPAEYFFIIQLSNSRAEPEKNPSQPARRGALLRRTHRRHSAGSPAARREFLRAPVFSGTDDEDFPLFFLIFSLRPPF